MDVHPTKNGINRYWSIPMCCKRCLWLVYSSMYRNKKRYCILLYLPGNPKASFSHRLGLTRFFCHYGFVGSIEGPIWRTQIRSANARQVKKKIGVLLFFYQYVSAFFWRIVGMSASSFGPKSIKLTCCFHQTLLIFNLSPYGKKHAKLEIRL
jgi:hypothetical protein